MSERSEEIKAILEETGNDSRKIAELVMRLSGAKRRDRQIAATVLHQVAKNDPVALSQHIPALVDALNRPEAQTRWECLEALTLLVPIDSRACSKAIPEADSALFDEESGPVRLAAMRFLCKIGATTPSRSEKVWSLIDEGIQCYHGDLEFNDMLVAITEFASGKLSDEVKVSLKERMSFDATNGKGSLQRKAQQIIDNLGLE
mgnify:CR=1 FL=1